MFFQSKIKSIQQDDRVLEIGPGSTPYKRSDVFLELKYRDETERVAQRGNVIAEPEFKEKPVYFYENNDFPFKDSEFDYVICSHVIEHVENPEYFLSEIFRVSKGRGYLEYPLLPYEYMYDFDVHLNFIKFDGDLNRLLYLPKKETPLEYFKPITSLLRTTLAKGWDDAVSGNPELFFEGFEYLNPFSIIRAGNVMQLIPSVEIIKQKNIVHRKLQGIIKRLGNV